MTAERRNMSTTDIALLRVLDTKKKIDALNPVTEKRCAQPGVL